MIPGGVPRPPRPGGAGDRLRLYKTNAHLMSWYTPLYIGIYIYIGKYIYIYVIPPLWSRWAGFPN